MKYIFIYLHFQCFLRLWTYMFVRNNLKCILLWNRSLDVWDGGSGGFSEYHPVVYQKLIFHSQKKTKNRTILLSINIGIEFNLFLPHSIMKDSWSTCKFRKTLRSLRNLHVDPLSFIPPSRIQSLIEMVLFIWPNVLQLYFILQRRFSHQFNNERKRCKSTSEEKRT